MDAFELLELDRKAPEVRRGVAVDRVTRFMDLNYPCDCTDDECPGNRPEAAEIVRMVIDEMTAPRPDN